MAGVYLCGHTLDEFAAGTLNKWGLPEVTYFVGKYPTAAGLSAADVEDILATIGKEIPEICGLRFTRARSLETANLRMGIGRGRRAGFDGPLGILAYCYIPTGPNFRGALDLLWDDDEDWEKTLDGRNSGIAFFNVTFHEILHGLGVPHTTFPRQLMNATYAADIARPQSHDRQELVDRYGRPLAPPSPSPGPTPGPTPGEPPRIVEARVRIDGGHVYGGTLSLLPAAATFGAVEARGGSIEFTGS